MLRKNRIYFIILKIIILKNYVFILYKYLDKSNNCMYTIFLRALINKLSNEFNFKELVLDSNVAITHFIKIINYNIF